MQKDRGLAGRIIYQHDLDKSGHISARPGGKQRRTPRRFRARIAAASDGVPEGLQSGHLGNRVPRIGIVFDVIAAVVLLIWYLNKIYARLAIRGSVGGWPTFRASIRQNVGEGGG